MRSERTDTASELIMRASNDTLFKTSGKSAFDVVIKELCYCLGKNTKNHDTNMIKAIRHLDAFKEFVELYFQSEAADKPGLFETAKTKTGVDQPASN